MSADRLAQLGWDLIPYTPHSAHMHMAVDDVLLQRVIAGGRRPTVRFWDWIEPALVIASHHLVVNGDDFLAAQARGFTLNRRMSGRAAPPSVSPLARVHSHFCHALL